MSQRMGHACLEQQFLRCGRSERTWTHYDVDPATGINTYSTTNNCTNKTAAPGQLQLVGKLV